MTTCASTQHCNSHDPCYTASMPTEGSLDDRIARLSEGQIAVLQLVSAYMSSKEIARQLGISHNTVDQRIKRIQAILGVRTRAEAARLYRMHQEGQEIPQSALWGDLVNQSSALPRWRIPMHQEPSSGEWSPAADGGEDTLRNAQANFAHDLGSVSSVPWFSALLRARKPNELGAIERAFVIVTIMILTILAVGALVSLAEGLSRLI